MPPAIITVAQQKGGAGKTTLAAHLALGLCEAKRRVLLLDADPQGSLAQWWALRRELVGEPTADMALERAPGADARTIAGFARDFDIVVADSPPHAEAQAQALIEAASLVVVPLQPSALDLWATRATIQLAVRAQRPVLLVVNRVPPRSGLADEMIAGAAGFGAEIAEVRLGNRVAFAAAMALGRTAGEVDRRSTAAREMRRLVREIAQHIDPRLVRAG